MKMKKSELAKLIQEMVEEAKPKIVDIPEGGIIKKGAKVYPGKKGEETGKFGRGVVRGDKPWRKNKAVPKVSQSDLKAKINEMAVLRDQVNEIKAKSKELEATLKELEDTVLPVIEALDDRQKETDRYLLKIKRAGSQAITPDKQAMIEYALSIITEEQKAIMEQVGLDLGGRRTTRASYDISKLGEESKMVEEGLFGDIIDKIKSAATKVKSWWAGLKKIDKANDILAEVADSL